MSHLSSVELNIKDQTALIQALLDQGIKLEHIQVSDSPILMSDRQRKANVLIAQAHSLSHYTDMGFELMPSGNYKVHMDLWGSGKALQDKILERYGFHVVENKAKALGYRVTQEKTVVDWLDASTGKQTKKECVQLRLRR